MVRENWMWWREVVKGQWQKGAGFVVDESADVTLLMVQVCGASMR